MDNLKRMEHGLVYDPNAKEILDIQFPFQDRLWEFNKLKPSDIQKKREYMKDVFASCGDNCYIELPFRANWGGHHIHFGNNIYVNSGCTFVDDGHIYIRDNVMFGPNVMIATANHPIDPELRKLGYQYNRNVHIEENVWIGGNVVIVPGITIGKNSVIGAGSVVTKDIPANVVAVGNPCHVVRKIGSHDKEYLYKGEKIDEEILKLLK